MMVAVETINLCSTKGPLSLSITYMCHIVPFFMAGLRAASDIRFRVHPCFLQYHYH